MKKWLRIFPLLLMIVLVAAGCVSADRTELRVPKGYFDARPAAARPCAQQGVSPGISFGPVAADELESHQLPPPRPGEPLVLSTPPAPQPAKPVVTGSVPVANVAPVAVVAAPVVAAPVAPVVSAPAVKPVVVSVPAVKPVAPRVAAPVRSATTMPAPKVNVGAMAMTRQPTTPPVAVGNTVPPRNGPKPLVRPDAPKGFAWATDSCGKDYLYITDPQAWPKRTEPTVAATTTMPASLPLAAAPIAKPAPVVAAAAPAPLPAPVETIGMVMIAPPDAADDVTEIVNDELEVRHCFARFGAAWTNGSSSETCKTVGKKVVDNCGNVTGRSREVCSGGGGLSTAAELAVTYVGTELVAEVLADPLFGYDYHPFANLPFVGEKLYPTLYEAKDIHDDGKLCPECQRLLAEAKTLPRDRAAFERWADENNVKVWYDDDGEYESPGLLGPVVDFFERIF